MVPYVWHAQDHGLSQRRRSRGLAPACRSNRRFPGRDHPRSHPRGGYPRAAPPLPQSRARARTRRPDAKLGSRRVVRQGLRQSHSVTLLLDAGALYAQADRADPHHAAVAHILQSEPDPLITSAVTVAEADYLILTRLGIEGELAFLEDLAGGTFQVECVN